MTTNPPAPAGDGRASLRGPLLDRLSEWPPGFAYDEIVRALVLRLPGKSGGAARAEDRQWNPAATESAGFPPLRPAPNGSRDPLPHKHRDHAGCDPSRPRLPAWCSAIVPQFGAQLSRQSPAPAPAATPPGSPTPLVD